MPTYYITNYDNITIHITDGWREWYIPKFRLYMVVDEPYITIFWTDTEKGRSGITRTTEPLDYNVITFGYISPSSAGEVEIEIQNMIDSAFGGGGGITSIVAGDGIDVDNADPENPIVEVDSTVVRTTGNQTISGAKVFTETTEVGENATASPIRLILNAANNVARIFSFRTGGLMRWAFRVDGNETGSDAGGDLAVRRYDDSGTFTATALRIRRDDGEVRIGSLAGTGTRMVVADSDGDLSTQAIANITTQLFKAADETISSDATVGADNTLQFAMVANKSYYIRGIAVFNTVAAADFKYSFSAPAAFTYSGIRCIHTIAQGSGLVGVNKTTTTLTNETAVLSAAAGVGYVSFEGILINGANAGTFSFNWAQDASDAGSTTVKAGSMLEYKQVD